MTLLTFLASATISDRYCRACLGLCTRYIWLGLGIGRRRERKEGANESAGKREQDVVLVLYTSGLLTEVSHTPETTKLEREASHLMLLHFRGKPDFQIATKHREKKIEKGSISGLTTTQIPQEKPISLLVQACHSTTQLSTKV